MVNPLYSPSPGRYESGIPALLQALAQLNEMAASRVSQIEDNLKALENTHFTSEELAKIDRILA